MYFVWYSKPENQIEQMNSQKTTKKKKVSRENDKNLTEDRDFFRQLVDSLEDYALFTTDKKGIITTWNSGAKRLLKYSGKEIIGKNADILFTPEDLKAQAHKKELQTALSDGRARDERWHVKKGGIRFWGVGKVFPLKDTKGQVQGFTKVMRDLTIRQEFESKLKLQTQILESMIEGVSVSDNEGIIVYTNTAEDRMFGYRRGELIGQHVSVQNTYPQNENIKIVNSVIKKLQEKGYWSGEFSNKKKDGTQFTTYARITAIDIEGKKHWVCVQEDVTQRKQLESQKDEFVGVATHELKTPVTSIKAYAQILKNRFQKVGDKPSTELLSKMDAQLDKLISLISDLLDVTKIEAGKMSFNLEQFNFNALVGELVEELQRTTTRHTIEVQGKVTNKVYGDRDRTGQVLTNLISNAIKYSPHSDRIIVMLSQDKERVTLCVQDFGVGIPKKRQEKVFERFYRVSGPKEDTFPGLGLGLYISSEIVKRQGGRIWVESARGKGSTFCFSLPFKQRKIIQQSNPDVEEEMKHD
jgi:two-component system, chemotaxis family, CheB/CheR fusion protein